MKREKYWAMIAILGFGISACQQAQEPAATEEGAGAEEPAVTEVAANRGLFGQESCASNGRVALPTEAAYALYYDDNGNLLGSAPAEVLDGTQDNRMCPADPPASLDPGVCTPKCPKVIGGRTYCVTCPPGS